MSRNSCSGFLLTVFTLLPCGVCALPSAEGADGIHTTTNITMRRNLGKPVSSNLTGVGLGHFQGTNNQELFPVASGELSIDDLLNNIQVSSLRYSHGFWGEFYFWDNLENTKAAHTLEGNSLSLEFMVGDRDPSKWWTPDSLVAFANRVGAEPLLQVNTRTLFDPVTQQVRSYWDAPGSTQWESTPSAATMASIDIMADYAADYVRYVNIEKGYGVKTWEIGNETYAFSPSQTYRYIVEQFSAKMRAVDPTIELIAAGYWGGGVNKNSDHAERVAALVQYAPSVEYLASHDYGGHPGPGTVAPPTLAKLESEIDWAWGNVAVRDMQAFGSIASTEWNTWSYGTNPFHFTNGRGLVVASRLNALVRDEVPIAVYNDLATGSWGLLAYRWKTNGVSQNYVYGRQPTPNSVVEWQMTPAAMAFKLFNEHRGDELVTYGQVGNSNYIVTRDEGGQLFVIYVNAQEETADVTLTDLIGVMPSEGGLLTVVGGDLLLEDGLGGEYSEVFPATESFWFGVANTLDNYPQWIDESPLNPTAPGTISFQVPAWSIGYLALGSPAAATVVIPEPSTLSLILIGPACLWRIRRHPAS